ncbi:MAG: diacylglycerol kinase family lipid kinase [bacterium]
MPGALAVINPVAGRARGAKLRARARAELARLIPGIEFVESERPGHATDLARAARGRGLVVAVGGDGTAREVAAGLAGSDTELAAVPVGSGNDFCRNLGIPPDVAAACRLAAECPARPIDLGRLESGGRVAAFANAAGFGFDARVIVEARRLRHLRGMPLYLAAVLLAVRDFDCPRCRLAAGAQTIEQPVLLVAAANGPCYGGGMKVAPDAALDDGLFDLCVIAAVGRLRILRCLPELVRGTHGSLPEVRFLRAAELALEFDGPVPVQLDGDLLDWPDARRFRLEILPRALRVRAPAPAYR